MTRTKRQLAVESLERREVPNGTPAPPLGIWLGAGGIITMQGDDRPNAARVWMDNGQVHAKLTHEEVLLNPNLPPTKFTVTDADKLFPAAQVKGVTFYGAGNNDSFENGTALPSTAYGGTGDDSLKGGSGNDSLIGGPGQDSLEGGAGNDQMTGGSGDDTYVFAPRRTGLGSDVVTEAANVDTDTLDFSALTQGVTLYLDLNTPQTPQPGYLKLRLSDGLGIENVVGSGGNDLITGNARVNVFEGMAGNDTFYGGAGNDELHGGDGNDELHGGSGNDILYGDDGYDQLFGDQGDDLLDGGRGDDTLRGSAGNDKLYGGDGNDFLAGSNGNDTLLGGFGNDFLAGGEGDDSLSGGVGNDCILGFFGNDVLHGDQGDDLLDGGPGTDTMDGGIGYDQLFADMGNETLANGEHVEITVPAFSPQTDDWSCGPNSAARLLQSYGINVSYEQLRAEAQTENFVSYFGLGTPPPSLLTIMQWHKPDMHLASGATFQDVLDRLGEGRPVIALIGWGELHIPAPVPWNPLNFDTAPANLHYICLTGFDQATSTLFYTDTDGVAKTMSFSDFQQMWDWPGDGMIYAALSAAGVKKQTILW